MKQPPKTLLLWVVVLVAFLSIWHFLSIENPPRPDISYSEFIALTKAPKDARHIDKVEIKDREYTFLIKNAGGKGDPSRGRTVGPVKDDDAAADLVKNGVCLLYTSPSPRD